MSQTASGYDGLSSIKYKVASINEEILFTSIKVKIERTQTYKNI